jgi:hypothetical protein
MRRLCYKVRTVQDVLDRQRCRVTTHRVVPIEEAHGSNLARRGDLNPAQPRDGRDGRRLASA